MKYYEAVAMTFFPTFPLKSPVTVARYIYKLRCTIASSDSLIFHIIKLPCLNRLCLVEYDYFTALFMYLSIYDITKVH